MAIDMYNDPVAAMKFLTDQYNMLSKDDSSTLALYGCGYETYADFQAAVRKRMAVIKEKYVSQLPGLLDVDYVGDLERLYGKAFEKFSDEGVARRLLSSPEVLSIVVNDMDKRKYAPYREIKNGTAHAAPDTTAIKDAAWARLVEYVKNNWLIGEGIRKYIPEIRNKHIERCGKKGGYKMASEMPSPLTSLYKSTIQTQLTKLDGAYRSDDYLDMLAGLERAEQLDTASDYIVALKKQVLSLVDKEIEAYMQFRDEQQSLAREYLEFDKETVDGLLARLENLERVENMTWAANPACPIPMGLKQVHEEYIRVCENLPEAEKSDDGGALLDVAIKYWCGNKNVQAFIWNQFRELVPDALIEEILSANPRDAAELKRLTAAVATREMIYSQYINEYNRNYRPSRL